VSPMRAAIVALLLCLAAPVVAGDARKPPQDQELKQKEIKAPGGTFRVGQRVRLGARDGRVLPEESNHPRPLAYGPGQTGVVLRFIQRRTWSAAFNRYLEPIKMAVVKWDAQTWYEWDLPLNRMKEGVAYGAADLNKMNSENGPPVKLPAFERPAYLESLTPAPAEK
jgi:hypothetical protein